MESQILKIIATLFFMMVLLSCNRHVSIKENEITAKKIQKLVSLSKSSCFGKCPVYHLTIYSDGLAILESKVNLEKLGVFHTQLSAEQLEKIKKKISTVDWKNTKSHYIKNIPDLPTSTLSFYKDDSTWQKIESNSTMTTELEALHSELSEYPYLKNWILALKDKEINSSDAIKNELQIDMDTSYEHTHLEKLFSPYNFKTKERISQYMNFYLFTYDLDKISPAEMVVLTRRVKGVRLVSFNKKLKLRDEF